MMLDGFPAEVPLGHGTCLQPGSLAMFKSGILPSDRVGVQGFRVVGLQPGGPLFFQKTGFPSPIYTPNASSVNTKSSKKVGPGSYAGPITDDSVRIFCE
jgi:hypothetical protein